MKKTITSQVIDEKIAKNGGKYLSIMAQEGRHTCWEATLFPILQGSVGRPLDVEIMLSGKYENIVGAGELMPTQEASNAYFPRPRKEQQIEQAQNHKAKLIGQAMDSKELSIKISSTMRDAVLIATTLAEKNWTEIQMKNAVTKWREWLWANWEK